MPRRKKNDTRLSQVNGQYRRTIGRWINSRGKLEPKKFLLGRDLEQAQLANLLLERLWRHMESYFERERERNLAFVDRGETLLNSLSDPRPLTREEIVNQPAQWTEEVLPLAEAARKGLTAARIPRSRWTYRSNAPDPLASSSADGLHHRDELPAEYAQRLADLQSLFPGFQILAEDEEAFKAGQANHARDVQEKVADVQASAAVAKIAMPAELGATLYAALDEYAEYVRTNRPGENGRKEAERVERTKNAIEDLDLGQLNYNALVRIRDYWSSRPASRARASKGKRAISIHTVNMQLKTARRFVRWLDRNDRYDWVLPRHGLEGMKVDLRRLKTPAEIASLRNGVQVFQIDHLQVLWEHASDFERLLILLGLNCASAQAEATSLRWDEVDLDEGLVKRVRVKSGVYGEFVLWPETVQALKWWRKVRGRKGDLVLMTERGGPYNRQRLSNTWNTLRDRIEKATASAPAWWLSFKYLRKTAAQLVRNQSDGEITAVFLQHGQPVQSDELADLYSNRPFAQVGESLERVRAALQPVFAAVPDAFTSEHTGGRGPRKAAAGAKRFSRVVRA